MAKWKLATFNDVLTIVNGRNQKQVEDPNGQYPIYGSGGVMGYASNYLCDANTVVIGRKGTINRPIFVQEPFWNVDTAFGLRANDTVLFPKYLFYFCELYDFEALNTTVTIPSLTKANLLKVGISLPPLSVQQQIADVLDRASALIEKRKVQIAKLDLLIKSQFIEMFGDPVTNPKGWEGRLFHTICENLDSLRQPITASERTAGPIPYYGASGIVDYVDGHIFDEPLLLVSEDGANLLARVTPIAFSVNGKVWVNNHAHVLRFESFSTQLYIEYYLNAIDFSIYITGSAQPKLNQANLNNIPIPLPPLSVQNEFAVLVNKVETQKSLLQQSAVKLELNYKSLMQKCFRGEIF